MTGETRSRLSALVRHYVTRTNEDLSEPYWRKLEAEFAAVTFAWTPNHIHSVLREISGDWGDDLIARHYAEAHREAALNSH